MKFLTVSAFLYGIHHDVLCCHERQLAHESGVPGAEELLEYEDYQNAPTQGHANAFIRQVQEDFAEPMSRMENYLD